MPRYNHHIARITVRAFAPALVAALGLALVTPEAAAQDAPWGGKKTEKPATKEAPKAPVQKAPQQKAPVAPAPAAPGAAKAPAAKAPAAKAPAVKAPAAKAAGEDPVAKKFAPDGPAPGAKAATKPAPVVTDLVSGFKAFLEPHGTWLTDKRYGLMWVPDAKKVGADFAPYRSGGRWGVTEQGDWAWVSDYDWGKVPFHYGRWIWSPEQKWAWIPGEEYAPAHVVWRTGDAGYDFVGWAPMAPTHYWIDDAPVRASAGVLPFYFVPSAKLFTPNVGKHVVTDRKLGEAIHSHSNIHKGHAVDGAGSDGPLEPSSPTFGEARIPPVAIPKTRLSAAAESIAPLSVESLRALLGLPEAGPAQVEAPAQVETPAQVEAPAAAPKEAEGASAPSDGGPAPASIEPPPAAAPPPVSEGAKRFATPPPVYNQKRIRYRCWWTNTRPRIWRCGY